VIVWIRRIKSQLTFFFSNFLISQYESYDTISDSERDFVRLYDGPHNVNAEIIQKSMIH
jgi:hypothetical protein